MNNKVVHCKFEKFDVYVGRPSKWGNLFTHKDGTLAKFKVSSPEEAVQRYEEWLLSKPQLVEAAKIELKGKTLGCWCKIKGHEPCHGDVLYKIANEDK